MNDLVSEYQQYQDATVEGNTHSLKYQIEINTNNIFPEEYDDMEENERA